MSCVVITSPLVPPIPMLKAKLTPQFVIINTIKSTSSQIDKYLQLEIEGKADSVV